MTTQSRKKAPRREKKAPAREPLIYSEGVERLFELSIDMLCVAGFDGYFKLLNPAWKKTLGWSKSELLAHPWLDYVHPDDREATIGAGENLIAGKPVISFHNRYRCRDGGYRWLSWNSYPLPEKGLIFAVIRDITEQKKGDDALRENEYELRTLVESQGEGTGIVDADEQFIFANPTAHQIFGVPPGGLIGRSLKEFTDPEQFALIRHQTAERRVGKRSKYELEIKRPDGTRRTLRVTVTPRCDPEGRFIGSYGVFSDITEQKKLEQQLIQSQKMDAVGRLAGGIAHDFNNLLTTIIGNAELLLLKGLANPALQDKIKTIKESGERAAQLTRQLLTLSRRQITEPVLLNVNQVIGGMDRIFSQILGPDIRSVFRLESNPRLIQADQGQLEQVLLNLVANAREAMPQGGTLTVATANVQLEKNYVGIHPEVKPGKYLQLTIGDSGKGMPAEVRDHLFEPFFSTKSGGTGLGLSTVYGIVTQADGHIMVYSEEGEGTTFKLYFPALLEATDRQSPGAEPVESVMPIGSETILVVEDEEEILTLTVSILTGLGYTVLAAADKDEALRKIAASRQPIDLLLSDVILPGCRGPELAAQLRNTFPEMKILFMSGYADDQVVSGEIPGRPAQLLAKPFSASALAKKVRQVLDQN